MRGGLRLRKNRFFYILSPRLELVLSEGTFLSSIKVVRIFFSDSFHCLAFTFEGRSHRNTSPRSLLPSSAYAAVSMGRRSSSSSFAATLAACHGGDSGDFSCIRHGKEKKDYLGQANLI